MKKIKLLALILVGIFLFPLIGCECGGGSGGSDDEKIDSSRTQIYIDHYNGGVGNAWFKPLKDRFEAAFADYKLGDKTGVQLIKSDHKTEGNSLINSVSSSSMDVFFSEKFDYYEGINKDLFLDITDVVTEANPYDVDNKTIKQKYNAEQQKYFEYNGKYYGIPHYVIYSGLIYSVDLFENEFLYFSDNPSVNGGFITSLDDGRSNGPDGKTGIINGIDYSVDDGLPATYEQFFKLCDRMIGKDIIPFTWSGEYGKGYFSGLFSRLMATYEGKEQTMLNFTFTGNATHLVDNIADDGTVTLKGSTPISLADGTGKQIYDTAGRYYALKFAEMIGSKRDYYDFSNTGKATDSHTDAQIRYVLSNYSTDSKNKPIAFFVDGSYWENEAYDVGAFKNVNVDIKNARFGYLPLPRVDETHVGDKEVMLDNSFSLAFINKNVETRCPEKISLLKEFMKFAYTDESLREYTVKTNSLKGLDYTLTESDLNELSYFTKSLIDIKKESDIVYPYDNNEKFITKRSALNINATFSTNSYAFASKAMIEDKYGAKRYFNDLSGYLKGQW